MSAIRRSALPRHRFADPYIKRCYSRHDFEREIERLDNRQRGAVFERLVQLRLYTHPALRGKFVDAWHKNNPEWIRINARVENPDGQDEGVRRARADDNAGVRR
jgi:hypothetical protein